jgi:site-specific DNA-methyltransferase (adenine-specific)
MNTYKIHEGDCRETLRTLPDNSVDSIVTDPPYELGFMGKAWDSTGIAYDLKVWAECLRVLKPGGHLLAFSGSRTYHRMACAIEDAGFEIRDQLMWVYGSGFPKSHNISKALDKSAGVEFEKKAASGVGFMNTQGAGGYNPTTNQMIKVGESCDASKQWDGWGTALKPAHEPIVLARKPLDGTVAANVLKWGVGGLNIDACRVDSPDGVAAYTRTKSSGINRTSFNLGTTKSAGITNKGRFPANLMHNGSQEVLDLFPGEEGSSAARFFYCPKASKSDRNDGCDELPEMRKSDRKKDDGPGGDNPRNRTNKPRANHHPTVKPTELMRYLCRLITPLNGTVLDPFTGSGSTGRAAILEGFNFIGCELNPEYITIAEARIKSCLKAT